MWGRSASALDRQRPQTAKRDGPRHGTTRSSAPRTAKATVRTIPRFAKKSRLGGSFFLQLRFILPIHFVDNDLEGIAQLFKGDANVAG